MFLDRFDSLGAVTDDEAPPATKAMHSDPAGLAPSETTNKKQREGERNKKNNTHTHIHTELNEGKRAAAKQRTAAAKEHTAESE
jgi:hypothetical protein